MGCVTAQYRVDGMHQTLFTGQLSSCEGKVCAFASIVPLHGLAGLAVCLCMVLPVYRPCLGFTRNRLWQLHKDCSEVEPLWLRTRRYVSRDNGVLISRDHNIGLGPWLAPHVMHIPCRPRRPCRPCRPRRPCKTRQTPPLMLPPQQIIFLCAKVHCHSHDQFHNAHALKMILLLPTWFL